MKPLTLWTVIALVVSACGGESRETAQPRLSSAESTNAGWPTLGRGEARFIHIDLGPDTYATCQKISPKFPFDSAQTYAQDRMQLEAFAACLASPAMQDRRLLLVGRADPSGTDRYNDALGLRRANAIKQILVENGIAPDRIDVVSVGKIGAVGDTPDYTRGFDRRVDVIVKGGTHVPDR